MNFLRRFLISPSLPPVPIAAALFCFALAWAGCRRQDNTTSASSPAEKVSVALKEWSVMPDRATLAAGGRVLFKAKNTGTVAHELVILKTDRPANALTVKEGMVREEAAGKVVGEVEEFAPGLEKEMTLDLSAGAYVLFCNVLEGGQAEGHYQKGMRAAFMVGPVSKR
ncbi:cupredoxin domain-containing protein [Candidatus Manganitrophus noduliformans]|uniref:EfeO-type cupredoxin-like domain-containing protein n=1 Tax=Candidatus Manganitrophus noduliformans TaxID=2606439 RepID=A0A7X6IDF6_9BACT|nr:cupredoxin domain-containing protein [Candidatus Manganitrophus noduliformans]NKE73536.1 hypothetical protein [Candidatus Manganitrophus noduliformans]